MLTASRRKLIQIARRQLGLTEEHYRLVLQVHGGVESSKDLDDAGFDRVMKYLRQWGFRPLQPIKESYGERAGFASPAQIELIRRLWRDWSGGCNEKELGHWMDRKFHVSALRFLDTRVAPKVITALRAMVTRKRSAA